MADLKVTNAPVGNPPDLQKDAVSGKKGGAVSGKKGEGPPEEEVKRADEAVRVDVDPRAEKLADASPLSEQAQGKPAITEQAARQLALDVRQKLKDDNLSFVGESEKSILGQFS
jgi:hypothetical protein